MRENVHLQKFLSLKTRVDIMINKSINLSVRFDALYSQLNHEGSHKFNFHAKHFSKFQLHKIVPYTLYYKRNILSFTCIVLAHLTLNQINILVLVGIRADELAVELRSGGVDTARSRGDNLLALGQVEVRRRQDLASGEPHNQQEAGKDRRQPHPASSR